MADTKQYISQIQEHGTVMITEDVISTIVTHAIHEVEGVVSLSTKPGSDIADLIGKKQWGKGLKINIYEDNTILVECDIILAYGQSVVAVANTVQESVTSAIESMTGSKVVAVNVNVCGIAAK